MKKFIPLLLLISIITSCSLFSDSGTVCTSNFRSVSVYIVDAEGESVMLDDLRVYEKRFEVELDVCEPDGCAPGSFKGNPESGSYVIIHDHFAGKINGVIDIMVEGSSGELSFREEFTIEDDGCHVSKRSGPDAITAR